MKRKVFILLMASVLAFSGCEEAELAVDAQNENVTTVQSTDLDSEKNTVSVINSVDDTVNDTDTGTDSSIHSEAETKTSENPEATGQNETVTSSVEEETPTVSEPEYTVEEYEAELYVTKPVNIRKGPGTEYERVGALNKGDKVLVNGKSGEWYRFEVNNQTVFSNSSFFADETAYNEMLAKEETDLIAAQEQANADLNQARAAAMASPDLEFKEEVLRLVNVERANAGLPPLTEDATLDSKAKIRADELPSSFSHTRPDGSSCFTVLDGVSWTTCGENIAAGQRTPQEVVNDWMNSEGHRANIMSASFTKIGIGLTYGGEYGTYWVQLFTD